MTSATQAKQERLLRTCVPGKVAVASEWGSGKGLVSHTSRLTSKCVQKRSAPQGRSKGGDVLAVVEIDNFGQAHIRFGNGTLGFQPPSGMTFNVCYRVGNGIAGNVGAEAISRLVLNKTRLDGVSLKIRNPLPARGGTQPESVAEAKLFAPHAFRKTAATALASGRTLVKYLDFDVGSTLADLDLPVYGIWGALDATVPVNVAVRRLIGAAPGPVTVRILPNAGHQLPTDTGWEADLANWIRSPPDIDADDISGVEPASAAGVSILPASRWYLNPILHTIVSAAVAIAVFVGLSRGPPNT